MVCLPVEIIHYWIMELAGESKNLRRNKWNIDKIIRDYFYGPANRRLLLLKEKTLRQIELERLRHEVEESETMKRIRQLENEDKITNKYLKEDDNETIEREKQLLLFDNQNNPIDLSLPPSDEAVVEE